MKQPTGTLIYILILSLLQFTLLKAKFSASSRLRIKRDLIESFHKASKLSKSDLLDKSVIADQLKQEPFDIPSTSNRIYNPSEGSTVKANKNEITEEGFGNKGLEKNEIEELEINRIKEEKVTEPQLKATDIVFEYGRIVSLFRTSANSEMKAMYCLLNGAQLDQSEANKLGSLLGIAFADFTQKFKERSVESKQIVESAYPAYMDFFQNFYKAQLSTLPKNWDSMIAGLIDALQRSRRFRYREIFEYFPNLDIDIRRAASDMSARAIEDLIKAAEGGHKEELELGLSDPMRSIRLASAKSLGLSNAADLDITLHEFWKGLQKVSQEFTGRGVNRKLIETYEKEMILAGDFKKIKDRFPELLEPTDLPSSSSQQIDEIEEKVTDGSMMATNQEYEDATAYLFGSKAEEIKEFKMNDPKIVHQEFWRFSDAVLVSPKCIKQPEICFDYYLNLAKTMRTQKGLDNCGPPLARAFLNKLNLIPPEKDELQGLINNWPEPASHLLRTTFGDFFDKHSILEEKRISLLEAMYKHVETFSKPEEFNPFWKPRVDPFSRFPYIVDANFFTEGRSRLISGDSATIRFFKYFSLHNYRSSPEGENRLISDLRRFDEAANLEISRSENFWTQMIDLFESTRDQPGTPSRLMKKFPNLLDRLKDLSPEIQTARENQWKEFDAAAKEKTRLEKLARLEELKDMSKEKDNLFGCIELIRTATSWFCKRYKNQPSLPELPTERSIGITS
ncbi:uncharacterized protein MELLADRAFT_102812 [Melampsora larici-populina 98AG31]|uniref:Secreted protein n=1 Tax=Melampsora larici-populina (strain 98AG31 / pathotype 3-4-7) TaxID=747676 RepID=F4R9G5_MELLP|nr:uncharacterized protein MELLADRAFT_102812 [Melampsora larici-populina 98AG31]EGG10978.1 hypothetical protein MELLADRAFT_102812 [Melampsora larici-populina 98AG31]